VVGNYSVDKLAKEAIEKGDYDEYIRIMTSESYCFPSCNCGSCRRRDEEMVLK